MDYINSSSFTSILLHILSIFMPKRNSTKSVDIYVSNSPLIYDFIIEI